MLQNVLEISKTLLKSGIIYIEECYNYIKGSDRVFTYLKVKNYKSLSNVEMNLLDKGNKPKKLAILYGENGAGKSNLSNIFYTLAETLRTMSIRNIIQEYLEKDGEEKPEEIIEFIKNNFKDTERIIKTTKMINSKENMVLEYGFAIGNEKGNYILEMDNEKIVREELYFTLDKNKGYYFKIAGNDNIKLNERVFITKDYYNETMKNIEKFWGKHSLLSILMNEIEDKTDGYVEKQLNKNLFRVIEFLNDFACLVKIGNKVERGKIGYLSNLLYDLDKGKISINKKDILIKTEELLNEFFTSLYADIKQVFYNIEEDEQEIKYKLVFRKMINNEIMDVDFSVESTGTQQLLTLLPFILSAIDGKTVIIDEFDSGIHDLLVKNLLTSIYDSIRGQLIMTTHNTLIMESNIDKNSLYVISVNKDGIKEIKCISEMEGRIQRNNNIRNRYLGGLYNGIPSMMYVDFEDLLDILE